MRYCLVLLLLSGCATMTPQQRGQMLVNTYGPICEQAGIARADFRFASCVLQLANQDAQRRQAQAQQLSQSLAQWGQIVQQSQPQVIAPTIPFPTRTNCYTYGNSTNCRTW